MSGYTFKMYFLPIISYIIPYKCTSMVLKENLPLRTCMHSSYHSVSLAAHFGYLQIHRGTLVSLAKVHWYM